MLAAQKCMSALDAKRQDITMLWLLAAPASWLMHFKAGAELCDWTQNTMEVPLGVASGAEFQEEVTREFMLRGVRPVAPERVLDAAKKDLVKNMCLAARWPRPCFPVLLQLRPPGERGLWGFVMFSSWQDAAVALAEMSRTQRYHGHERQYTVGMVYEMQLVDMGDYDQPCRIILDCDAKPSEFGDAYSVEALGRVIDEIPLWFVRKLAEMKAIPAEHRVVVMEKEKSRANKASRHYVFSIMGVSTWDIRSVLKTAFPVKGGDEQGKLVTCCQLVDRVPHHGRGQYSVLGFFDKGKKETEYPCITRRLEIVNGKMASVRAGRALDRSRSALDGPDGLRRLQEACYTFFKPGFITLHPSFMEKLDQVKDG